MIAGDFEVQTEGIQKHYHVALFDSLVRIIVHGKHVPLHEMSCTIPVRAMLLVRNLTCGMSTVQSFIQEGPAPVTIDRPMHSAMPKMKDAMVAA